MLLQIYGASTSRNYGRAYSTFTNLGQGTRGHEVSRETYVQNARFQYGFPVVLAYTGLQKQLRNEISVPFGV